VLGDADGFVAPLLVGWVLDFTGGTPQLGGGMSFTSIGMLMLVALLRLWALRPREFEGDQRAGTR
jgi:hypothetical protein